MPQRLTREQAHLAKMLRDPMYFRENIVVEGPNGPEMFGNFMADFQRKDFAALDPALKFLAGVTQEKPPKQRFYIQRGRGSSKTTDRAVDVLWLLFAARRKIDGVVCAEDREQALLIREQLLKILQYNTWLYDHIDVQKNRIKNKRTDATLNSLSRDKNSSFGLTPDITIVDEFTHMAQQDFWSSVFSSFNKRVHAGGILIVTCNAGVGRDWKWNVHEMARQSDLWHYSAPHGHAPWYQDKDIDEQRGGLSVSEFRRLWMNEWQDSGGEFITLEEADRCQMNDLFMRDCTEHDGWQYVASLDYAEKHDRTVGVVTHLYNGEIIVDRMDVIDPYTVPDGVVRLEWCEQWIDNVIERFGGRRGSVIFVADKWQLLYLIQKLTDKGVEIYPFDFKSGSGNWEMSMILRGLILHQKVKWYPGCGEVRDRNGRLYKPELGRDDLASELAALNVKNIHGGRWRFEHTKTGHDDRSYALGAACRHIVMCSGGMEEWALTPNKLGRFEFAV